MPKKKLNLSDEERKEYFRKYREEWRANNKEKIKMYYEEYKEKLVNGEIPEEEIEKKRISSKMASDKERLEFPSKYLHRAAKERAKRNNIEFYLDVEDIIIPTHCPVLGIELSFMNRGIKDNSPSLDRIDPSKGYIKGNVMVMSFLANSMKRTADSKTLLKFADWVYSTFKAEE